ncbi:MAG: cytochrome b/b6 domain-containing protein [Magnetococcales bacterium]|nr:cytochrome b/b6 domain-containing protein [Magnetococcales bacterium]
MTYDRITRLLHLCIAVGITGQQFNSLVMVYPKPGRAGDAFYALHEMGGQVLLGLLLLHWIWSLARQRELPFVLLFPWFSPERYGAILADAQRYLNHARVFRLPDTTQQAMPLASAIQGLGLLTATLLGISGVVMDLGMEKNGAMIGWVRDIKEIHEVLGSLMWLYLVVHATMGMLHQWSGHGSMRAMIRVWEKNPSPDLVISHLHDQQP